MKNKEFRKSRQLLEESLEIDPELSPGYLFLGNAYSEESEVAYKKAIEIDEKEFQSSDEKKHYTEYVNSAKKQLSKAIPLWIQFTEINPDQSWIVLPKIKDALFALNRFNEIENVLKNILKKDSDNIDALSSLADFYNQKGSQKEAIEIIESAIEKKPDSLIANVIQLKLSSYKGNFNQIRKDCDKLIGLFMEEVYQHSNSHLVNDDIKWLNKNSPNRIVFKA